MTEPQTIILIGTSHSYQTQACKTEDAQAFQWFLLQKCRQSGIKRLAEELNKEASVSYTHLTLPTTPYV